MLIIAQTLFYFTVSFAIIALSVLAGMIAYHLVKITKELRRITDNLGDASDELRDSLSDLIERLSSLPILSMFLSPSDRFSAGADDRAEKGGYHKKGRSK